MTTVNYCTGNHILIGLGGTGGKILRAFKMRMFEEFPSQDERNKLPVSLLYVDSTDEMMPKEGRPNPAFRVMGQDASFTQNEFLNIKAVDINYILDHINNYPQLKGIVGNVAAVEEAIGNLGAAAGQKRRAGRILFAANGQSYVNALQNAYGRCTNVSGNETPANIYIFAGLCGGTGSGSIIDAIVQARKTYTDAAIYVYAMIPERNLPNPNIDQGRYYQNGYAAVSELNALQSGRWHPCDITGRNNTYWDKSSWGMTQGVANGITLYSNVNTNGIRIESFEQLPKIVGDFIFARIFYVNETDQKYEELLHAFRYENMNDFAFEYDETATPDASGKTPVARTKKINSFGIKRVMYPELRVLKHITYTVGEKVLLQFKYNNWKENRGFVDSERNMDYNKVVSDKVSNWMLDESHLFLEKKILESDPDYVTFKDYWHEKAVGYANEARQANDPLTELDNILKEFYANHFNEEGVEKFYNNKRKTWNEMAKEIRSTIEHDLFEQWKEGKFSIVELQKVSAKVLEKVDNIYNNELLEAETKARNNCDSRDQEREANVYDWTHVSLGGRLIGKRGDYFTNHQLILEDLYVNKTKCVAIEFARGLVGRLRLELTDMDSELSAFAKKISDAIEATEKLVAAHRKTNKGLEDMKEAVIEVSEDDLMKKFETQMSTGNESDMRSISIDIREKILEGKNFTTFGRMAALISTDEIKDAFDTILAGKVKQKHDETVAKESRILGLNVLTQLRQKLITDDDINAFAFKTVQQSGAFLKLDNNQMQLHVRNNEGELSPSNPASINKKSIFVIIPSPDKDDESMQRFINKLETAFMNSIPQGGGNTSIKIIKDSPKKDELLIIMFSYLYPMRSAEWLAEYKVRYENSLNPRNAILFHSEGDGKSLPSLFVVENAEEIAAQSLTKQDAPPPAQSAVFPALQPATMPSLTPQINLHIAVGGQVYGPFTYELCKQMVQTGQLTAQSMVWMQGMVAWTPASQVTELQDLFAPVLPSSGPTPMPPTPDPTPPPLTTL